MDSKTFTGLMDSVNSVLEGTGYSFSSSGLWLTTSNGSRKMSNFIVVPEEFVTKDSGRSKKEIYVKATGYNVSQNCRKLCSR